MLISSRLNCNAVNCIFFLFILFFNASSASPEIPEVCSTVKDDGYAHYFDYINFKCSPCSQPIPIQLTSKNRLFCECEQGYIKTLEEGNFTCQKCPEGKVVSGDGWTCVKCGLNARYLADIQECLCSHLQIRVLRYLKDEVVLDCEDCPANSKPYLDSRRCDRCVPEENNFRSCTCKLGQAYDKICHTSEESMEMYQVRYSNKMIVSSYLKKYAHSLIDRCSANNKLENNVMQSCESLINLCKVLLEDRDWRNLVSRGKIARVVRACSPLNLPILETPQVSQVYTFPNSTLDIVLTATDLNGDSIGTYSATDPQHWMQLCARSSFYLNSAFIFGTNFKQECEINVKDLYDENLHPSLFFQAYLRTKEGSNIIYHSIPIFVQQQPALRFFMVDNKVGKQNDSEHEVRYASSLHVEVVLKGTEGLIHIPSIFVEYSTVNRHSINKSVKVSFQVSYNMEKYDNEQAVWISVGVMAGLALIVSGVHIYSSLKRQSNEVLCCFYSFFIIANHLSNAISLVLITSSIWTLFSYKNQKTVTILVHDGFKTPQFLILLLLSTILKIIGLIRLIYQQVTTDVFLVDWEAARKEEGVEGNANTPSVWRMYLVANEWNELQCYRKINPLFQLILSILFLDVLGVGNMASMDALQNLFQATFPPYHPANQHYASHSALLRFSWLSIVYLGLAFLQAFVTTPIYERFFEDKIGGFIDLCSTCNISILMLRCSLYGHYIHGRTVHARSDVGLQQMHENFAKEEKDLVGKRGLLEGDEQQTFEVRISGRLRSNINKIIQPSLNDFRMQATSTGLDKQLERSIQSHYLLSQLLKSFIDHLLEEDDYSVKRKNMLESLFDFESSEATCFYYDNGHSFDQCILYGHDISLVLVELLLCACIDALTFNFTLSLIVTFLFILMVSNVRGSFGKRNLARKTMVDQRFLI